MSPTGVGASERGSTTTEAALSLSFLVSLIAGGFGVLYFVFAYVWIERAAYEAAVCLASTATELECRTELETTIHTALPIGTLNGVRLLRDPAHTRVHLKFMIEDRKLIEVNEALALPLASTALGLRSVF